MKRLTQHILAFLSVVAAWMTIYMLLSTDTGESLHRNHESFFSKPETEVSDMGGLPSSILPEYLFPLSSVADSEPRTEGQLFIHHSIK